MGERAPSGADATRGIDVPDAIERLADELAASAGVEAVVLGGSRGAGDARDDSDWDLGVHYRGPVDLSAIARHGEVHPPGSWGRLMNGGAWLDLGGLHVDVLLRDMDAVEHWWGEAQLGRYEVDALLGYVAGVPTYSLVAELAIAVPLRGGVRLDTTYPTALRSVGTRRWRIHRDFSLRYAAAQAARDNVAGALGQLAKAVLEEAHARRCESGTWALNEKRLLDGCGLEAATRLLRRGAPDAAALADLVREVRAGIVAGMPERTKPSISIPEGAPPAELQMEDEIVGEGLEATTGKRVVVHYAGVAWSTGRQFDASWDRGDTFDFRLGGGEVISGWDQGVAGMRVGGRRRLTIPPDLGYGSRGAGGVIKGGETLVFVVDLVDVV